MTVKTTSAFSQISADGVELLVKGMQGLNSMSSKARSFPIPEVAVEVITKTTEVAGALNVIPYLFQVREPVTGISPLDIESNTLPDKSLISNLAEGGITKNGAGA